MKTMQLSYDPPNKTALGRISRINKLYEVQIYIRVTSCGGKTRTNFS